MEDTTKMSRKYLIERQIIAAEAEAEAEAEIRKQHENKKGL